MMTSTSIWSAPSTPAEVESRPEPESDADEPTRLSDPRIVEITKQIEVLTLMIKANHAKNRTKSCVIAKHPNEGVGGSNWRKRVGSATNEKATG
jgi:hypothetical protein